MRRASTGYLIMIGGAVLALFAVRRFSLALAGLAAALIVLGWFLARGPRRDGERADAPGIFEDRSDAGSDFD